MTLDSTSCPLCDSDDYTLMDDDVDGMPDYDGVKRCEECGAEWV